MSIKDIILSITKKEWRFVILFAVLIIIITTAPYIYAYLQTPADYFYLGTHSISPGDTFVYFSYINQIKEGNWLIEDYFTSEPQISVLNILWLKVGLLARIFNLSPFLAFQVFRIILIPVFVVFLYVFLSYFLKDKLKRKLALIFSLLSSGLGAYFAGYFEKIYPYDAKSLIYKWPIDLWVGESNIFLTLYQSPHFILSLTCLLIFTLFLILALKNNNYWYSFLAGLIGLAWFNFHPYYFIMMALIFLVYIVVLFYKNFKYKYFVHYLVAFLISFLSVLYHVYLIKTDLVLGIRASQNITLTPPILFVIIGFGFLFVFAVLGMGQLFKEKKIINNDSYLFLFVWLVIGFIILYIPIPFARRFLMGLQIPLVIFTIIFLFYLLDKFKDKVKLSQDKLILSFFFLLIFGFSTFFNLVRDVYYYQVQNQLFYLPIEYQQAADWLRNNYDDKIVLAAQDNGYVIPGLINQKVYLGHSHETVLFEQKANIVNNLLSNHYSEEEEKDFLQQNNIGYLFYTEIEKNIGEYSPEEKDYWQNVFSSENINIYKFIE